jgi:hypothetical protein
MLLSIHSPSSAYVRDVARTHPFGSLFLNPSVLWAPTTCTHSKTSNDHALYCMLNHGDTLVQLLHCLPLSSHQLKSTVPSAAQLLLSQSQQDDLVEHHLLLLIVLERISRPRCEPLYATNTSHHKQETFLYEYPLHRVLLPTKKHATARCSSVIHSSSTVAILTTETSL